MRFSVQRANACARFLAPTYFRGHTRACACVRVCVCVFICMYVLWMYVCINRARKRRWYSDSLPAGRSKDRFAVGPKFFAPVETGPGTDRATDTIGSGCPTGRLKGRGVSLTTHPFQHRGYEKSTAITLLPL